MAVFTNIDIKKRRKLLKMTAADLAEQVGRDPTTIYDWESGKADPHPDDVYMIAEAFNDLQIWYDWMRTKFTSYARMHPETVDNSLPSALLKLFAEMGDVEDLQRVVSKDGADGKIDDPEAKAKLVQEVKEMIQMAQRVIVLLGDTKKKSS